MKSYLFAIAIAMGASPMWAQESLKPDTKAVDYSINKPGSNYFFTPSKILQAAPVEDQCKTSTCWSYSTLSLLESELIGCGSAPAEIGRAHV